MSPCVIGEIRRSGRWQPIPGAKCDWRRFHTHKSLIFGLNAQCDRFYQVDEENITKYTFCYVFLTWIFSQQSTRAIKSLVLGRSKDEHTALALWYLSTEVAKEQERGRIYTGNTGNCKGDKKVADHIPVDFVMFHTKKCLAYYTYTYNTKREEINDNRSTESDA